MGIRMAAGVVERADGWYARRTIPADVRHLFPSKKDEGKFQTDFLLKLPGAANKKQAVRLAGAIQEEWASLIDQARRGEWPPLSREAAQMLAAEFWSWAEATSAEPKYLRGSFAGPPGVKHLRTVLTNFLSTKRLNYLADGANFKSIIEAIYYGSDLPERTRMLHGLNRALDRADANWAEFTQGFAKKYGTTPSGTNGTKPYSFAEMIAGWAKERTPVGKTRKDFEEKLGKLAKMLGHTRAAAVTKEDVIKWKDKLVGSTLSPRSIHSHLIAAKTLFNWAFSNNKISVNPTAGITYTAKADPRTKRLAFTDEEAAQILSAARKETEPHLRWLPWMSAYTGARIEEIAGAMVKDVERVDGVDCLRIRLDYRGEGASLKTEGSERTIPLHAALITEGFLEYIAGLKKDGPLFPQIKPDGNGSRGGVATRLIAAWVRKEVGIVERRKAPSHSWRHYFKTISRRAGIEEEIHDALTGHRNGSVSRGYGSVDVKTLKREIDKIVITL